MPRGRAAGTTKTKVGQTVSSLSKALAFISVACKKEGTTQQLHCQIRNKQIIANDGVISCSHPIPEDITANPHAFTLIAALNKCKGATSVTIKDGFIIILSGKFSITVPCAPDESIYEIKPDISIAPLDNKFREALIAVSPVVQEKSVRVVTSSFLLTDGSVVGTNGLILLESFHCNSMPTLVVPKSFATALSKTDGNLVSFGFSDNSLTVYFDNGAWIRTQLYVEKWPNYLIVFGDEQPTFIEYSRDLWEAIDIVKDFAEEIIYVNEYSISTHDNLAIGAMCGIDGIGRSDVCLPLVEIQWAKPFMHYVDFMTDENKVLFYGTTNDLMTRGCVLYRKRTVTSVPTANVDDVYGVD